MNASGELGAYCKEDNDDNDEDPYFNLVDLGKNTSLDRTQLIIFTYRSYYPKCWRGPPMSTVDSSLENDQNYY